MGFSDIAATGAKATAYTVSLTIPDAWRGEDLSDWLQHFASGLEATEDFENVLSNVEGSTSKGGSGVTGSGIRSPGDFPAGFLKVLFRPFPQEANNEQALASSLEGALLLLVFAWRFFPMLKNGVKIRRNPYLIFVLVFTLGFIVAFSSFNNFGLLARQRSQVMPYFLALLIGLGWSTPDDDDGEEDPEPEPLSEAEPIPVAV